MRRLLTLTATIGVLAATPAHAAFETLTLETEGTSTVPCQAGIALGEPAAAVWPYVAPRDEALTVRTDAPAGTDYDLAVFDRATGTELASSAAFDSIERATVLLEPGQVVDVQVCRRSGGARAVTLTLESQTLRGADAGTPRLVEVALPDGPSDARRLAELGLDVTHEVHGGSAELVLYSDEERRRLEAAGFAVKTIEPDLPAALESMLERDALRPPSAARALPSGRTTYRTQADYGTDLKAIADANPTRVRQVTMPGESLEGRAFEGVEIANNVGAEGDGRPIFLLSGLTHAREWPGGELAMEFAIDLASSNDPRMRALRDHVRVFVFPMANPDGFAVSRTAGAAFAAGDDRPSDTTLPEALSDAGAYKRKNCRAQTPETQGTPCASRAPFGVDLNRAYSAYWGGEGSSNNPATQQYRGPAPFTEPEALAVRGFAQANQVQVFITNHTYTDVGRILRQPGFDIPNDEVGPTTVDEARMKALGDAMGEATGYVSELGYDTLGNITGPADDFLYYSQGTYGYTPEMRGINFHTDYADAVIGEYEGEGGQAGRGWREAYIVAAEFAADPGDHVILKGTAPADATLRLRKDFALPRSTDSDGDGDDDVPLETTPEKIDATLEVGPDGTFEWHVNPSKRPYGPADEPFTLTCERGGQVVASRTITAVRGETKTFDFADCAAQPAATVTATPTPTPTTGTGLVPTPTVSPTATPTATPEYYALPLRVRVFRPPFSARRVNRRKRIGVRVVLRGQGSLRAVRVAIRRRGGPAVLRGRAAQLTRSRTVRLKRVRRIRAGRHRIVLTASGGIRVTKALRIKR